MGGRWQGQIAVAEKSFRGAWIDTENLSGPKHGLHMTQDGHVVIAKRFAKKAIKLLQGEK